MHMTVEEKLRVSKGSIAEFCRKWKITEFALFGSVLRGDFSPDSDVDVLVTFHSSADCDYEHLLRMKEELERLFERPVDLLQRQQIENSDNYIRRKHILTNLETVYVA
jgi:predicted nucleotidyltransferase